MNSTKITIEEALEVARLDAESAYRDLSPYRVDVRLGSAGWHIEYWLKDPGVQGGGPHYIIDAQTGAILSKTYYQ